LRTFNGIPTPQAGGAFTFVIATKVSKKSRLKKGDCALLMAFLRLKPAGLLLLSLPQK
jgi:hypothetical protein